MNTEKPKPKISQKQLDALAMGRKRAHDRKNKKKEIIKEDDIITVPENIQKEPENVQKEIINVPKKRDPEAAMKNKLIKLQKMKEFEIERMKILNELENEKKKYMNKDDSESEYETDSESEYETDDEEQKEPAFTGRKIIFG